MEFIEELKWRGLVKDVTDLDGLVETLKTPTTVYCGFDPTADSLHVGHLQQIILLRYADGYTNRDIAAMLDFSVAKVDKIISRARKQLALLLEEV